MRFAVVSYRVWSECCMISCYSIAGKANEQLLDIPQLQPGRQMVYELVRG